MPLLPRRRRQLLDPRLHSIDLGGEHARLGAADRDCAQVTVRLVRVRGVEQRVLRDGELARHGGRERAARHLEIVRGLLQIDLERDVRRDCRLGARGQVRLARLRQARDSRGRLGVCGGALALGRRGDGRGARALERAERGLVLGRQSGVFGVRRREPRVVDLELLARLRPR